MTYLTGTLIKITSSKKLFIKINEQTYEILQKIGSRYPEWTNRCFLWHPETTTEHPESAYFASVSLDKYDRQQIRRFELLLHKEVKITGSYKPYNFTAEDKVLKGVNFVLEEIRHTMPTTLAELLDEENVESELSRMRQQLTDN